MKNRVHGRGFRLAGLVLGIVAAALATTSIVFSAIGMHQARLCKNCHKGAEFQ